MAIKQAVRRVGTTCSTVDERERDGERGKRADPTGFSRGRRLAGRRERKGRWRSTTHRTTRTCVCKTITRVHALARGRALTHTCARRTYSVARVRSGSDVPSRIYRSRARCARVLCEKRKSVRYVKKIGMTSLLVSKCFRILKNSRYRR